MVRDKFRTVELSPNRIAILDSLHEAKRKPVIHALATLDVTSARQALRDHEARTGRRLSFTAFIVHCLARAVDADKTMQAYRRGSHLVIFDDVDVCVLVEHAVGTDKVAAPHVIRAANRKSLLEIHEEIRTAQKSGGEAEASWRFIRFYPWIPRLLRRIYWRQLYTHPGLMKRTAGTVCVTSVGMFGPGAGWGIPITGHTLTLTVGGIESRTEIMNGESVRREHLSLTVSADHEVVDGAPLARFVGRLRKLVESGDVAVGTS